MKSDSDFAGVFDLVAERLPFAGARLTVFAPCLPLRVRALVAAPPLDRVAVFAIGADSFCGRSGFPSPARRMWLDRAVTLEGALVATNRNMAIFDIGLGSAALLAPRRKAQGVFGHDDPPRD